MSRRASKFYRVPPVTGPTVPQPFQSFNVQRMRQLPVTLQPGAIALGNNRYFDVTIGPSAMADTKHLLITADITFTSIAPGPPLGLVLFDLAFWNTNPTAPFNAAAACAMPIPGPALSRFRLTWDFYRNGTKIYGSMSNDAYTRFPSSAAVNGTNSVVNVGPVVGLPDFSIENTLSVGVNASAPVPNITYSLDNVRALIEAPVNIGRAPL